MNINCYLFSRVFLICIICTITQQRTFESFSNELVDNEECVVDYLKRHDLIDCDFKYPPYYGNQEMCDERVYQKMEIIYDKIIIEFNKDKRLKDHIDCLISHLKAMKSAELTLDMRIQETCSNIAKKDRVKTIKDFEDALNHKKETAIYLCKAEYKLGSLFDEIMEPKSDNTSIKDFDTLKEEYCTRKYVVEHKLLERTHFRVHINPKWIYVSEQDCLETLKDRMMNYENEILDDLTRDSYIMPKRRNCMQKRIRRGLYFNAIAVVEVLSERNNTDAEKNDEKNRFLEAVTLTLTNVLKC
ncbi:unnamed protein product [Diamesa hyperborea]